MFSGLYTVTLIFPLNALLLPRMFKIDYLKNIFDNKMHTQILQQDWYKILLYWPEQYSVQDISDRNFKLSKITFTSKQITLKSQ